MCHRLKGRLDEQHEQFLEEMDAVMPWEELHALVEPHYSAVLRRFVGIDLPLQRPKPAVGGPAIWAELRHRMKRRS